MAVRVLQVIKLFRLQPVGNKTVYGQPPPSSLSEHTLSPPSVLALRFSSFVFFSFLFVFRFHIFTYLFDVFFVFFAVFCSTLYVVQSPPI